MRPDRPESRLSGSFVATCRVWERGRSAGNNLRGLAQKGLHLWTVKRVRRSGELPGREDALCPAHLDSGTKETGLHCVVAARLFSPGALYFLS